MTDRISFEDAWGAVPKKRVSFEDASIAPDYVSDILKSGASGLQQGVVGLAGLPGDLIKGGRWLAQKAGLPTVETPVAGSAELQKEYENIGGPTYKPQTTAGEYAETVGAFAPAALGGVGSLGRRAVQAVVPAVTSETAGQVARQVAPEHEGVARLVGGIGGIAATARSSASKLPKGAAPDTDELRQMANLAYTRAEKAGLVIKGGLNGSFGPMVIGLVHKLKKEGIDPTLHPKAMAVAQRLVQASDNPQTLQEIDTLRRVVKGAAKSIEPDERRLAQIMVDRIDDYLANLGPKDIQAGNLNQGVQSIREARSLWQRMRKSEMVDEMLERAGLRAGQFSVSGNENAIRTEFRQLAMKMSRDKRTRNMFTAEEQKLIRQLANMGSTVNILRTIGKLAPRSTLAIGGGVVYGLGNQDPLTTGAAWGAGSLAQIAALGLTKRKAKQLQNRVRAGNMNLIPGAPASLGSALIGGQAAALPFRDQLPD